MRAGLTQRRVRAVVPAVLAAVALTLSACSSGASGDNASDADITKALGTPNKATGSPVLLGLISDGKGTSIDQSAEIKGAQAAIGYANDYLGGINGHAIQLKVCETQNSPSQATDCANQMVSAKVSAVVAGTLAEADQVISVLGAAKIPAFFSQAASKAGLSTPGIFSMTNALNYFSTPAAYAKQQGFGRATMVVIDVPGASGPAQQIGSLLFGKANVAYNVVPIPPGTADMTPQIQAAEANSPKMYMLLGDATFCSSAIKALRTLGVQSTILASETCVNSDASASIPGGYDGVKVVASLEFNSEDAEFKTFKAALSRYGDGTAPASIPGIGYAVALGLVRALNAAKVTDTSPAGLQAAVQSAPPVPYPLNGGATFQCNGKAVSLSPNICSANGIIADAAQDGTLSNYQVVQAGDLLTTGG
ncbi:ABC transporter substrate-binding protein [Amycolatopsis sp.]|uniref:ABC transporter substrate-binding protein n=1 Tax=Amycolatopsis sp. TaxID=37632 RepID=UPI002B675E2C|nr:ABC transporter substrate-binding protein [Amycolatopsis sp.]HVV08085.1 ABC transporter substrate-binding protein [Amycolatopsis sp.]